MAKSIIIAGSLDTKGEEFSFIKSLIIKAGLPTLVIDFGVMGTPSFTPDVSREDVCSAGGGDLSYLSSGSHKDEAMATMSKGLSLKVRELYDEGRVSGIISMGGSGGTSVATAAMRELPVGIPKIMVSTVGGGDVSAYAGTKDITFMPSIVDVAGINSISRTIYENSAGAIIGMVKQALTETTDKPGTTAEELPIITASMFGNTTEAVDNAREIIAKEGYEVLVFHATGIGGRTMESLITDGYVTGNLDMTTTELADTVCGGVFDAGPSRCQAAAQSGVPTIIVPGCVDMANFGGRSTVPDQYQERLLYEWNPDITLLRTNVEENRQIGKMIADAANLASAPITIIVPTGGVSMLDSEGERFWDPSADRACFDSIKNNLNSNVNYIEDEHNINDPEFSSLTAKLLLEMLK